MFRELHPEKGQGHEIEFVSHLKAAVAAAVRNNSLTLGGSEGKRLTPLAYI